MMHCWLIVLVVLLGSALAAASLFCAYLFWSNPWWRL